MILTYKDYSITSVYGQVDKSMGDEIVAFWATNHAISDPVEARRRTGDVVFVIRNAAGEIAGIASAYISSLQEGDRYFFYRMFIQPRDRIFGMMRFVTLATRDFLQNLDVPNKPQGMVIVTENVKLMRKAIRRVFGEDEAVYVGKSARGLDIWKHDFKSASE